MTLPVFYGYWQGFEAALLDGMICLLKEDSWLSTVVNGRVYTQYISTVENPQYPAITIIFSGSSDKSIDIMGTGRIAVDVWSSVSASECSMIYASNDPNTLLFRGVRSILSGPKYFKKVQVDRCYQQHLSIPRYDDKLKKFRISAVYFVGYAARQVQG